MRRLYTIEAQRTFGDRVYILPDGDWAWYPGEQCGNNTEIKIALKTKKSKNITRYNTNIGFRLKKWKDEPIFLGTNGKKYKITKKFLKKDFGLRHKLSGKLMLIGTKKFAYLEEVKK